jgi:hypothetical protein
VSLVAIVIGLMSEQRFPRVGRVAVIPVMFLLVPLLQSVPIPLGPRRLLDREGTALLVDNSVAPLSAWPMSLDPVTTRLYIARGAVALVVFLVAFHVAGGQRHRQLVTRAIAIAGVTAVLIGLGHRMFGVQKLYGTLNSTGRTLMTGPFVNSNHTSEFLELASFVCLACSFHRQTVLNRVGWITGMLFNVAGAIATLSRGAVAALGVALLTFVFFARHVGDETGKTRRRSAIGWGIFLLALMVLGAGAFGAGQLIDRFRASAITTDVRLQLWRDAWRVLTAHPWGIGRGAFDRVFPIHRTLHTELSVRFAFVENEPLQLLVDLGWVLFALLSAAFGLAAWHIARRGRHDKIEAALVAGLVAVLVHGLVDFGLETLGVLLPFAAILGTVLGRSRVPSVVTRPQAWAVVGLAGAGLLAGLVAIVHSSNDNFDALLNSSATAEQQRRILERAQKVHPLDYFYALAFAGLEPIKGLPGGPSPRLHALNRALRLCPGCDQVHQQVARTLWRVGRRPQALLEWRTAVQIRPSLFRPTLSEVFAAGATPEELAAIGSPDPARLIDVAAFLSTMSRTADAFVVLDQADALGSTSARSLVTRAKLQLDSGQGAAALDTIAKAHASHVDDPLLPLLEARLLVAREPLGIDQALAVLDAGAARYPDDVEIQRMRFDLSLRYQRWQSADRALRGLEYALYRANWSVAEVHLGAARLEARLARWTSALGRYRIALADDPSNPNIWMEYGRAAESAGRDSTAREAYGQAARLSPKDPEITAALSRVSDREARLKVLPP